jgi:hypothetical protein
MIWKRTAFIFLMILMLASCDLLPVGSSAPEEGGQVQPPAETNTETPLPSNTPAPTATIEPTTTETPVPTVTNIPATSESLDELSGGGLEVVPTAEIPVSYPFSVQTGSPIRMVNIHHSDAGCNWFGIAGQIFDLEQLPVPDLVVKAGGFIGGQEIFGLTLSGLAGMYGPGGYEIVLGDQPFDSKDAIWIQLYDMSGTPLSAPAYIDTVADCGENLIILNFSQLAALMNVRFFFPQIFTAH